MFAGDCYVSSVTEHVDPTGVSGVYLGSAQFKPWQGPDFSDVYVLRILSRQALGYCMNR
jgi:hypothetical protein